MSASFKTNFLDLPRELRDEIYRYLLSTKLMERVPIFTPSKPLAIHKAIVQTSRQVSREARAILYGENTFVRVIANNARLFTSLNAWGLRCMGWQENRIGAGIPYWRKASMGVLLDYECDEDEKDPSNDFTIAAEDLPTLVDLLLMFESTRSDVRVSIMLYETDNGKRKLRVSEQRLLLSPFKRLQHILSIHLDSQFDVDVWNELTKAINHGKVYPPAEKLIEDAMLHNKEGDEAKARGDFLRCGTEYMQAIWACFDISMEANHERVLAEGPYAGYQLEEARSALVFEFRSKMSRLYHKVHEVKRAIDEAGWALQSSREFSPLVTDAERADLHLKRGHLYQEHGEPKYAWRDVEKALRLDPQNGAIRKKRTQLRRLMVQLDLL